MSEDTIVAPASGNQRAAVSLVRLSGPDSFAISRRLFACTAASRPEDNPRRFAYGRLTGVDGELIDECLAVAFRAPASYTGEDVVEFHLHGNPLIVSHTVSACIAAGARPADPGEFTKRAFLNGKLSLAAAEAVADVIEAESNIELRAASGLLAGSLGTALADCRARLVALLAELEAGMDFVEEDIAPARAEEVGALLTGIGEELQRLASGLHAGAVLRSGLRIALAGLPNAGKSSLLNRLLGAPRALVTDEAGTTRDVIEERLEIEEFPFVVSDTAGLRVADGRAETAGIDLARRQIETADIVCLVWDVSGTETEEARAQLQPIFASTSAPVVVAANKCDLPGADDQLPAWLEEPAAEVLRVSAKNGEGITELTREFAAIAARCVEGAGGVTTGSGARRLADIEQVLAELDKAPEALALGQDALAEVLRAAVNILGRLTGDDLTEEVLDIIFSRFCIGK